ncbi:MAG: hypothetical protein COA43_04105 [Robiginitomaculum sp.]|nr:MAG: hypothetical protein COA43_04105 [Robiginitomaculum sp.]
MKVKSCVPILALAFMLLTGCASKTIFYPKSDYPPDPWVKGYADKNDCIGGEKLAAKSFTLPTYPKRAFKSGRQGWVILRLDIDASGVPTNVDIERALPDRLFGSNALKAARAWRFHPPQGGELKSCRVLLRYKFGKVSLGG